MKKNKKLFYFSFFLLVIFFMSIHMAEAAEYYVAPNGNDANQGTSDAPWATFAYAMTRLQPGDTLIAKAGVYNQKIYVNKSGTAGNPIII